MVTLLFPIFSHGLRDSVSLFVGPFVPWSDHPSRIFFLAFCGRFLHHRYCPAAGDWCCCVWYTPLPLPYTSLPLPNTRGHVLSQTPNTSNFLSCIITLDVFLAVIIIFLINFPYFFQPPPLRPGFRHFLSPCYPSPMWLPSPPATLIPEYMFFISNLSKKHAPSPEFDWLYDFSIEWEVCRFLLFWGLFTRLWAIREFIGHYWRVFRG